MMGRLFPVVGLKDKATLVANFGGDLDYMPFVWKENEEVKKEGNIESQNGSWPRGGIARVSSSHY